MEAIVIIAAEDEWTVNLKSNTTYANFKSHAGAQVTTFCDEFMSIERTEKNVNVYKNNLKKIDPVIVPGEEYSFFILKLSISWCHQEDALAGR